MTVAPSLSPAATAIAAPSPSRKTSGKRSEHTSSARLPRRFSGREKTPARTWSGPPRLEREHHDSGYRAVFLAALGNRLMDLTGMTAEDRPDAIAAALCDRGGADT